MPYGDKTGPRGLGPRTGRGLGNCPPGETAYPDTQPLGTGRGAGRGFGIGAGRSVGRGIGRGWRWAGWGRPW